MYVCGGGGGGGGGGVGVYMGKVAGEVKQICPFGGAGFLDIKT
jgi:hypothetical protein